MPSVDPEYAPDPYGEAVNAAQIVQQARQMIGEYGFESIKLKAGVFNPDEEADAILALKAAFPHHQLRIDPNSNWSMATSLRVADKLAGCLEYYEDPTPTLEGMAALHRATGLPLATNMVINWAELRRSIELNAVQILLSDHHSGVACGPPRPWRAPVAPLGWACRCTLTPTWASASWR